MRFNVQKPTLREKKRYIAFEAISEAMLNFDDVAKEIKMALTRLVGETGTAKAGLMFLPDWKNNKGIIRISRNAVIETKSALALIKEIKQQKVIIRSICTSGMLNKARKAIGG